MHYSALSKYCWKDKMPKQHKSIINSITNTATLYQGSFTLTGWFRIWLLPSHAQYNWDSFCRTSTLIPCVPFHSSFSNSSWFLSHLRSINKHNQNQNFLPKAMNKNLYSYDFVHNYLFRIFIPVPWFSLVLIYMDHCIRNKLTNNIYARIFGKITYS